MGATSNKKHVFLSYCRENQAEVQRLRNDLVAGGENVWWDQDIRAGKAWEQDIHTAIQDAYAFVLCLSKESAARVLAGIYPEVREAIALCRQFSPGNVFLIPVRLSECTIPPLKIDSTGTLGSLQYRDLFPQERYSIGLASLLEAIRSSPLHPRAKLHNRAADVPLVDVSGGEAGREERRLFNFNSKPGPLIGIFPNLHGVLSREAEAGALLTALRQRVPSVVELVAPAGFGKTFIVRRTLSMVTDGVSLRPGSEPTLLVWIDCAHGPVQGPIRPALLCAYLNAAVSSGQDPDTAFFAALSGVGSSWWIFDNFDPDQRELHSLLQQWRDYNHQSVAIVLSRKPTGLGTRATQIDVVQRGLRNGLEPAYCADMLRSALSESVASVIPRPVLESLAKQVHCIPKAVEAIASYISLREFDIPDWEEFLRSQNAAGRPDAGKMADDALTLISNSLAYLEHDSPQWKILERLSLAQAGLPRAAFTDLKSLDDAPLTQLVRSLMVTTYLDPRRGHIVEAHPLVKQAFLAKFRPSSEETVQVLDRVAQDMLKNQNHELADSLFAECIRLVRVGSTAAEKEGDVIFWLEQRSAALMMGGSFILALEIQTEILQITEGDEMLSEGQKLLTRSRVLRDQIACLRALEHHEEALEAEQKLLRILAMLSGEKSAGR